MIAQNNKENEQSRVFVASHFLLATRNYHLSSQILLYLCKIPRSRSSVMRPGSFLPTDDQHYFSTKGSRLRYQLIFPSPLSPIIKPNLYEIKIESCCLIMVPARIIGWGIRFNAYIFFQLHLNKVVVAARYV